MSKPEDSSESEITVESLVADGARIIAPLRDIVLANEPVVGKEMRLSVAFCYASLAQALALRNRTEGEGQAL